jgi:hypothetical protein
MRTGGGGTETLMIAIPIAVLLVLGSVMSGGPRQFLRVLDDWLAIALRYFFGG